MKDTLTHLRAILRDALTVGAGAHALLACTDMVGIENDPGFVEVSCDAGEPIYLENLSLANPVDYIARGYDFLDGSAFRVLEEVGEPCLFAVDEQACLEALRTPAEPSSLFLGERGFGGMPQDLRATREGEIIRIGAANELLEFLGSIETSAEAVLIAASSGFTPTCSRSGTKAVPRGFEVQLFTHPGCDGRRRHLLFVSPSGEVTQLESTLEEEPDPNCVVGRRPPGLLARGRARCSSLAAHFARSAELEAASVGAFEVLAGELAAHAAPPGLTSRARASAMDEVRHARAVAKLSRQFGGAPRRPRIRPLETVRSLDAIALENAVEGCVRETYGALVAMHQARYARHPRVRELYLRIAADETRHAAFAWDVAEWTAARSKDRVRRQVRAGMRRAVDAVVEATCEELPRDLVEIAGLPAPATARAMLARLQRSLWRAPLRG